MKNKVDHMLLLSSLLGNIFLARTFAEGHHSLRPEEVAPIAYSQEKRVERVEIKERATDDFKTKERSAEPTAAVNGHTQAPTTPEESNTTLFAGYEHAAKIQAELQPTGDPVADITKYLSASTKVLPTAEMARAYLKEERSAEQRSYYIENLGRSDLPDATELIIKLYSDEAPTELHPSLLAVALIARNSDSAKTTLTHYFENSGDSDVYIKIEVAMHLVEKFQDPNADAFLKDLLQNTTDDFYREIIEIFYRRRGQK